MIQILPALTNLLCHPITHAPLVYRDGFFLSPDGDRFPIRDGIPNFILERRSFRHRFWEWVYNRSAFGYDFGVNFAWKLSLGGAPIKRESYLHRLGIQPGDRVLETAVGTGGNLLFSEKEAEFVGVDQSFRMLERCRRKLKQHGKRAALVQADMAALPFYSFSFDNVFHVGGLQFLDRPAQGIREMARVAKRNAKITIIDERASLTNILRRERFKHLSELAPAGAEEIEAKLISQDELFFLQFQKT